MPLCWLSHSQLQVCVGGHSAGYYTYIYRFVCGATLLAIIQLEVCAWCHFAGYYTAIGLCVVPLCRLLYSQLQVCMWYLFGYHTHSYRFVCDAILLAITHSYRYMCGATFLSITYIYQYVHLCWPCLVQVTDIYITLFIILYYQISNTNSCAIIFPFSHEHCLLMYITHYDLNMLKHL